MARRAARHLGRGLLWVYFLVVVATVWRVPLDRMAAAGLALAGRAPDAPGRPLDWLLLGLGAAALAALWGGYWRLLRCINEKPASTLC